MKTRFVPRIQQPCSQAWDEMAGDEKRRFCGACGLYVHNLSAMSAEEREAVFANRGERKCVGYVGRDRSIEVRTRLGLFLDRRLRRLRLAMAALAVLLPFGLGGCATSRQSCAAPPPPNEEYKKVRELDFKGGIMGEPLWRRLLFFWE